MRVVSLEEMRDIEKITFDECGVNETIIIENVGIRAADFIEYNFLQDNDFNELVVLVGRGNNGADGLAIARHLRNNGHQVRAFLLFPEESSSIELKKQLVMAKSFGVKISEVKDVEQIIGYITQTSNYHFIIDAILGTGTRLPISQYLFELFKTVNECAGIVVSIDIPSGITGENGAISSVAIKADCTLAVGMPKIGLYLSEGATHSGEIFVLDVGFPREYSLKGNKFLLGPAQFEENILSRDKFSHKNSFGHTLVVGGSDGMTGAIVLASRASLSVGSGLVTVATWRENYSELIAKSIPETITGVIPSVEESTPVLRELNEKYDSIVIGPGMGRSEWVRKVVLDVLNSFTGPVILDADAINAIDLVKDIDVFRGRKFPTILTPHIGEFARLIEVKTAEVLTSPVEYIKDFISKTNCTLVLKGPCSFVALPSGDTFINYFPNDGMATAGSGDVLAGILGGLMAQAYHPFKTTNKRDWAAGDMSVCLGVYLHSLAGKKAQNIFGSRSMNAGAIIDSLKDAFLELNDNSSL